MAYTLKTPKTWTQTYAELEHTFARWGVRDYEVRCLGRNNKSFYQSVEERTVSVRFVKKNGEEVRLSYNQQDRSQDNLRVLYLAIEALRMNEVRGIDGLLREAYLMLPAPVAQRDPYEVLGIRPPSDLLTIEAVYKAKAKQLGPPSAANEAEYKELNAARDRAVAGLA